MELLSDFLKILIPSGIVLYGMYLTVRSFIRREIDAKKLNIKEEHDKTTLPLRLQAYERICLLLERITPNNLILRLNDANYSSSEFHQILLSEVRNEYYHNLSQQIYVSDDVWELTQGAVEEVISIINQSAQQLEQGQSRSLDLAKKIFDVSVERENTMLSRALTQIKEEVRTLF